MSQSRCRQSALLDGDFCPAATMQVVNRWRGGVGQDTDGYSDDMAITP